MAKGRAQLRALTLNALQEVLRKRVLYAAGILVVLIIAIIFQAWGVLQMADEAGELTSLSSSLPLQAIGLWDFTAMMLAVFLGAVGISSEVSAKTIVHVLSRPVERTVYLAGRWLGVLLFLWAFQVIGILVTISIMQVFDLHAAPIFWAGCAEMLVKPVFFSGISLGLSVFMPPLLAGGSAFLLSVASHFLGDALHHPQWFLRQLANLAYYLLPAQMPGNLIAESFQQASMHPKFALYFQVMGENLLYTVAIFTVACVFFRHRELRLR